MARSREYCDGYRAASKDAQKLLQEISGRMADSSARRALDAARHEIGIALRRRWEAIGADADGGS
ncbi:MAG: hypothetical protein Kow0058_05930 [Roseovarius sp.]